MTLIGLSANAASVNILPTAWDASREDAAGVPPFRRLAFASTAGSASCHVAVVGACEGEAILLANWVHCHLAELKPSPMNLRFVTGDPAAWQLYFEDALQAPAHLLGSSFTRSNDALTTAPVEMSNASE